MSVEILKGKTELVEQAARDAAAYLPVKEDDDLRGARGIAIGLALAVPFWVAVVLWGFL